MSIPVRIKAILMKFVIFRPEMCNHRLNGEFIHYKPKNATEGKEVLTALESLGTRKLLVPNRQPIDRPGILPLSEFKRLKQQAHVMHSEKL